MTIKFVNPENKKSKPLIARNEIQAAAFLKQGLVPASKADEAKLNPEEETTEEVIEE